MDIELIGILWENVSLFMEQPSFMPNLVNWFELWTKQESCERNKSENLTKIGWKIIFYKRKKVSDIIWKL